MPSSVNVGLGDIGRVNRRWQQNSPATAYDSSKLIGLTTNTDQLTLTLCVHCPLNIMGAINDHRSYEKVERLMQAKGEGCSKETCPPQLWKV